MVRISRIGSVNDIASGYMAIMMIFLIDH